MSLFAGALLLTGRVLFGSLFAFSARRHIRGHERYATVARGKLPFPSFAGWPVGVFLVLADVSIVGGVWPDVGSLMVAFFLIPAAVLFHQFWRVSDPAQRRTQEGSFYRNVTLLGAALALFVFFATVGHVPFAVTGPAIKLP